MFGLGRARPLPTHQLTERHLESQSAWITIYTKQQCFLIPLETESGAALYTQSNASVLCSSFHFNYKSIVHIFFSKHKQHQIYISLVISLIHEFFTRIWLTVKVNAIVSYMQWEVLTCQHVIFNATTSHGGTPKQGSIYVNIATIDTPRGKAYLASSFLFVVSDCLRYCGWARSVSR